MKKTFLGMQNFLIAFFSNPAKVNEDNGLNY